MSTLAQQVLARVAASLGGASPASVMAGKRNKWACRVRHTTMLALRRRDLSFPQIGRALGGLDHTTVINGCKKAAVLEVTDDAVLAALTAEAKAAAEEDLQERLKRLGVQMSREHKRLADAAEKLIEAIDPDFAGDMPAALERLASAWASVNMFENPRAALVEALLEVSR